MKTKVSDEMKVRLDELIIEARRRGNPGLVAFLKVVRDYQPKKKAPVTAEAF